MYIMCGDANKSKQLDNERVERSKRANKGRKQFHAKRANSF